MPGGDLLVKVLDNPVPYIVAYILLSLVLWILASLICWWSQGALISMVDDVDQQGSTSVKRGWNAGKQRAIPLTIMSVLLALPIAIIALPAIAGVLWLFAPFFDFYKAMLLGKTPSQEELQAVFQPLMSNFLLGFACIVPSVCIAGILGWLLGLLNKVAARSFVLENLTITDSIKRGWRIARMNLGYVLLNGIVLFVISIAFGWLAAIPALIVWVPVARAFLHQSWTMSTTIAAIVAGLYFLLIAIGLGGILTSFNSTLWTKLYKAMVANENVTISANQAS